MKKLNENDLTIGFEPNKSATQKKSLFDESFFDEEDDFYFDEEDEEADFFSNDKNSHHPQELEEYSEEKIPQKTEMKEPLPVKNSVAEKPTSIGEQNLQNTTLANDIQFRLACELGQVLIPFENLQNLNVGSVVGFQNTIQTLYLSVNNVRVGEGMLVDVDGKIGVKITNWYGKV